ncbi:type I restriction enzyme S subunit [Thermonema lapsum]|uniref:Type I restriction enzyme S subunit n=1 Tax=Thermonema lapsum TaxID=28195 RepID=A0A846MN54_9BACT|nr:restriction endonuclease subunit S [Thermonema lapsum]NIK72983.1 type I restriction enzyme S subunit [Thermonema lapsum]
MKTPNDSPRLPRLRFPEFQNAGEWEVKRLGEVLVESRIRSEENDPRKRITVRLNQKGVQKREYRGTEAEDATIFFKRRKGQFIYGKQNLHKGAFGIIPDELDGFESSQDIPAFDFNSGYDPYYFVYYLGQEKIYTNLEKLSTGTGSKRIHPKEFLQVEFLFPSLPEQQKIAACLSSLDEVIAGEREKLALLQQHKKGLLQQLFPQEGETVPRLRFPEFQNAEEWEVKRLGDILAVESSDLALNKLELKTTGYAVYGADGIVGYIDDFQQKEPYISIVKDGSGVGRLNLCKAQTSILGTLSALKTKDEKKYNLVWAYYLLNTVNFSSYVKGAGIPHIYYSDYKHHQIAVANPAEQQKIAACLSSLDDLIAAQTEKIELLEQHKKGLVQGVFPMGNGELRMENG